MLAFLFFGAIAWHGHTRAVPSDLMAAMGQGAALLIAIAIFASAGFVEEAFSAKTILASIARLPQYAACDVVLPFGDEYSADFYQEAWLGRRLEHNAHDGLKLLVDALHHPHREIFVLRRREWQEMEPAVRQCSHADRRNRPLDRLPRHACRRHVPSQQTTSGAIACRSQSAAADRAGAFGARRCNWRDTGDESSVLSLALIASCRPDDGGSFRRCSARGERAPAQHVTHRIIRVELCAILCAATVYGLMFAIVIKMVVLQVLRDLSQPLLSCSDPVALSVGPGPHPGNLNTTGGGGTI